MFTELQTAVRTLLKIRQKSSKPHLGERIWVPFPPEIFSEAESKPSELTSTQCSGTVVPHCL